MDKNEMNECISSCNKTTIFWIKVAVLKFNWHFFKIQLPIFWNTADYAKIQLIFSEIKLIISEIHIIG